MSYFQRLATGVTAGSLVFSAFTSAVFADTTVEISGNGAGSHNNITVNSSCNENVTQNNTTNVDVNISANLSTGGNQANNNTGGNVTVSSGNATSDVNITVGGSSNSAEVPSCCGCEATGSATISNNGANSTNNETVNNTVNTTVKQKNKTTTKVKITKKLKTGKNKANNNTGGDVNVTSGDANSTVNVTVDPSSNIL